MMTKYILSETRNLGEFKRITGKCKDIAHPSKWSTYFKAEISGVEIISPLTNEDVSEHNM